ncbi:MAG: branched-chain amino acid ABC transporter permease [Actinomycetota bacterium]|nr:branched-chain amino acid ABC transporter permease [Actinomycetota bacterium]
MNVAGRHLSRAGVVAALAMAPFLLTEFRLFVLTEVLITGLFAASLGLLVGFTGLPSLGHAAYFGVGGYAAATVAIEVTSNGLIQIGAAVALAALVAAVTGWLAVRTGGITFLMLTLAFAQLLFTLAVRWSSVTGGTNGLGGIPRTSLLPGGAAVLVTDETIYFYTLIAFLLGYGFLRVVVRSPFGDAIVGIRENEARMRSLGYGVDGYKLASFCIAGAVAGYAGALFVQHSRFIAPDNLSFDVSALALIMVVVGGARTLVGPVIGAAVVLVLRDELSTLLLERWEVALGIIFVLIVYLAPGGISNLGSRMGWVAARRTGQEAVEPAGAAEAPAAEAGRRDG